MFRIITEGLDYSEHVLLKNGHGILLRPAKPDDFELVKNFLNQLSPDTLRMRFMASMSYVPDSIAQGFCDNDLIENGCLLALMGNNSTPNLIGICNYNSLGNGRTAEVSFIIKEEFQGKGIGTVLLEKIAGIAAANGLIEFEAEVLPENDKMISVFKNSGFEYHQVYGTDVIHVEFPVEGVSAVWERAELREKISVGNSLKYLLFPKSVAVIGASRDENSLGNQIFNNIVQSGFTGNCFPVNHNATEINKIKAFNSVSEIEEEIDLAVIAVPAELVYDEAKKAIECGVKGLVVVSAGFAEEGLAGIVRQEKLVKLIHENGVRLIGPSCLGLMNSNSDIKLNASLAPKIIPKGNAGFFSHSAALGLVIIDYARELGLGFSTFLSAGNRADVSGNDLLQFWEEDSATKMAILYLETFNNPRKFVRIARRMSYKKPILCVKSASSKAGIKTIKNKSGSEVVAGKELDALFWQTGIIKTETLEELFNVALVLDSQPLPKGNKATIIANSAGMLTLLADSAEAAGLETDTTELKNLGAFAGEKNYYTAVKESWENENTDSLIIGFAGFGNIEQNSILKAISQGLDSNNGIAKPIILCFMGKSGVIEFDGKKFPSFRFPESASHTLGDIVKYVKFLTNPIGKLAWYDDVDAEPARHIIKDILKENNTSNVLLRFEDSTKILNHFGINVSETKIITDNEINISVESNELFGPVIVIEKYGTSPIYRITPLTESDIRETIKNIGLKDNTSLNELIGRISQMIEELPWLYNLNISISVINELLINPDIIFEIKPGNTNRPDY